MRGELGEEHTGRRHKQRSRGKGATDVPTYCAKFRWRNRFPAPFRSEKLDRMTRHALVVTVGLVLAACGPSLPPMGPTKVEFRTIKGERDAAFQAIVSFAAEGGLIVASPVNSTPVVVTEWIPFLLTAHGDSVASEAAAQVPVFHVAVRWAVSIYDGYIRVAALSRTSDLVVHAHTEPIGVQALTRAFADNLTARIVFDEAKKTAPPTAAVVEEPPSSALSAPTSHYECLKHRADALRAASAIPDLAERSRIIQGIPECPAQ